MDKSTKLLYLHGGIHLQRLPNGRTYKRIASGNNLLDSFAAEDADGSLPLFISEGAADDKLASIYRSDYLSFAFSQFSDHGGSLVVFGHSLASSDDHILNVMRGWNPRVLAVSLLPDQPEEDIIHAKARLMKALANHDLVFFDATTHPLGDPELHTEDEDD